MPDKKQISSDEESYLHKNEYVFPHGLDTGPITKRSSTDSIFLLIFVICFIGFCGCAGYVFIVGNPEVLGKTYDTDGKMCGKDSGYENYPYLYYPIPTNKKMTRSICVKTCPTSPLPTTLDCKTNSLYSSCTGTSNDPTVIAAAISANTFPAGALYIYETALFFNRICLPLKSGTTYSSLNNVVFVLDLAEQWGGDMSNTVLVLVIALGVAIALGILYVWGMRYCSGILFFSTMFLSMAIMICVGVVFLQGNSTTETEMKKIVDEINSESVIQKGISARQALAYLFWIVCGLIYMALICVANKLKLMPKLMSSVSEYVRATPTVFLVAVVGSVASIGFSAYWLVINIYTVAIGDFSEIIDSVPYGTSKIYSGLQFYVLWYLAFFFWFHGFVTGCVQYIIASSAATWYCSQGTGQPNPKTISPAVKRLFRYHLGSIAFGALFLTFLEFTRILLSLLRTPPTTRKTVKGEKISRFACKCFDNCVAALERIVILINKNAYIQVALTGKDFAQSAHYAHELNALSPLVMRLMGNIGSVFTFYGKIFISSAASLIGLIAWEYLGSFSTNTYSPVMSVILIFFFSYAVGSLFVTIYGTAADTIIACFIIEEELNKNKYVPTQYGTKDFRLFMLRTRRVNMQIQI